jgi:hypothetical protein
VVRLDYDCEYELLHGEPMFDAGGFNGKREAFKLAWQVHGEELLEEFVAENPGQRPFAWWVLEHKKERPIADSHEPYGAEWAQHLREKNMFGYLHGNAFGGRDFTPLVEPEENYLDRHGLLTNEERRVLGRHGADKRFSRNGDGQ